MNPSTALRRAAGRAVLAEKMARSRAAMVGVEFWLVEEKRTTHGAALSSVAILQEFWGCAV